MIKNVAIYLSEIDMEWREIHESCIEGDGYVQYNLGGQDIRFNIMTGVDVQSHLRGMTGYIATVCENEELRGMVNEMIDNVEMVLGVVLQNTITWDTSEWSFIEHIANCGNGFFFLFDSIMLPGGEVVLGPLGDNS